MENVISDELVEAYKRDGVIVVPEVLDATTVTRAKSVLNELVAEAAKITENNDVYDLEPGHSRAHPRVRRIKSPHRVHPTFDEILRSPAVIGILKQLLGPGLRLQGAKLNMKAAQYGSPVEWHQDWAFYPHTNDDMLAIGVLLDDCELENGPLLVVPGSHTGDVWNHHDEDGYFIGLIDPDLIQEDIKRAIPCLGKAGSISFHHVRALHGSAPNTSNTSRNLLLYEVSASDAWPLYGVRDLAEYDRLLLAGGPLITPRLSDVPVRMPLPPAKRQGSIYENQAGAKKTFFKHPV